jgi:hypothetical protein
VYFILYKLKLTGRNLGRVFNFRSGCMHAVNLYCHEAKGTNLELKTWPEQLISSPPKGKIIFD